MDTPTIARVSPSASDSGGAAVAPRFTHTISTGRETSVPQVPLVPAPPLVPVMAGFDISKILVDVTTTGRPSTIEVSKNVSISTLNLLERIRLGAETLWRNPVRTRVSRWGRREVMHVFNGFFTQTILKEWDRYETFGKCYTAPDPFKNDDPPYKAAFII